MLKWWLLDTDSLFMLYIRNVNGRPIGLEAVQIDKNR